MRLLLVLQKNLLADMATEGAILESHRAVWIKSLGTVMVIKRRDRNHIKEDPLCTSLLIPGFK